MNLVSTKEIHEFGQIYFGLLETCDTTYAILLEASILLAPTSFIGISRTWLERIRTPQHDLCNRLGADAIRSTVGLRVLATLAFAFGWRA